MAPVLALLFDILSPRIPASGRALLDRTRALPAQPDGVMSVLSAAGRAAGREAITPGASERQQARSAGIDWLLSGATVDEIARVAALLSACEGVPVTEIGAFVAECYRQGDTGEKRAVLRSLALLSGADAGQLADLGAQACRSSVQAVFEAICCENPFPADRFGDRAFRQMVLKALFTGVALDRVLGLDARITPELQRMAAAFASERRAAGRPVPADVGRIVGTGELA
jgi:hypothetical protein